MARILNVGIAVLDHVFQVDAFPQAAEKYRANAYWTNVGGCATVAAVAVVRLGGQATLCTRLGRDANSAVIKEKLVAAGVDCSLFAIDDNGTAPVSAVFLDGQGERQIVNYRGGLARTAHPGVAAAVDGFDAVLVDSRWPETANLALQAARARGIPAIVDAESPFDQVGELMEHASHIAFAAQGLRDLSGESDLGAALRQVAQQYPAWVCVTDGERGTHYLENGGLATIPSYPIVPRDTLGAGDVWHGAFALALGEGSSEIEAIRFSNAVAALKCQNGSGWDAIPSRAETLALMAQHNPAFATSGASR